MKKTEFHLTDGGIITAASPAEFITNLRQSSLFDSDCTDTEYMKNFANRYKIQTCHVIRTDTAENFVEDLEYFGFILKK
jgi:hypothetical protein